MTVTDREDTQTRNRQQEQFEGIRNIAAYTNPVLASYKGNPVRLLMSGDAPGHSPVCQYVDEDGRIAWGDLERFTVIDATVLPPSGATIKEVLRTLSR